MDDHDTSMVAARPSANRIDHHRVVLARGPVAVDERGAPGEHLGDLGLLAEQEAGVFGAMGCHVEQRAAARQLGVPEVRRVRAGVALAGAHRREPPDRARADHVAHAEQVGVEDHVLEVGVEHAGVGHGAQHVGRLAGSSGRAASCTRRPCPRRRGPGRRRGAGGWAPRRSTRSTSGSAHSSSSVAIGPAAEALRVGGPTLGVGVAPGHQQRVAHVAQAERVELADEAAAEHRDPNGRPSVAAPKGGAGCGGGAPGLAGAEVEDDRPRSRWRRSASRRGP